MQKYTIPLSTKIKLLRTTYNLSQSELADIISLKTQSALFAWENETSSPLFENVVSLAHLFSVSLDWLAGSSQVIYTEDSVETGEMSLHNQVNDNFITGQQVGKSGRSLFLRELHQISETRYVDLRRENWTKSRSQYYSLSVRANLTVLLHLVPLADIYWAVEYIDNDYKRRGVLTAVKTKLGPLYDDYKEPGKKAKARAINLVNLIRPLPQKFSSGRSKTVQKTNSIYDVEQAYAGINKKRSRKSVVDMNRKDVRSLKQHKTR